MSARQLQATVSRGVQRLGRSGVTFYEPSQRDQHSYIQPTQRNVTNDAALGTTTSFTVTVGQGAVDLSSLRMPIQNLVPLVYLYLLII